MQVGGKRDERMAALIAERLAELAHAAAEDPQSRTPWMTEAAAAGALPFFRRMRCWSGS